MGHILFLFQLTKNRKKTAALSCKQGGFVLQLFHKNFLQRKEKAL